MKTVKLFFIILLIITLDTTISFADEPAILLDGSQLQFDVPPRIESGRMLVPLRGIFEAIGANVAYDPPTRVIQVHYQTSRIILQVDSKRVWINEESFQLDVPARVIKGRTLVPLRFIAESLDVEVLWVSETRTVYLNTNSQIHSSGYWDYTDDEGSHRFFTWQYEGIDQVTELVLDTELIKYYTNHIRVPSDNYSLYVTHPDDDDALDAIAVQFRKSALALNLNEQELIHYVIKFVQFLEYQVDKDANGIDEYPQYPLETLSLKSGDCEDTSILLSALLSSLGHDPIIIHYPGVHTAVGMEMNNSASLLRYEFNNRMYTYIETTRPYTIGRIPTEFSGIGATFFELKPAPAIKFRWESNANGIEVRVWNQGTGPAQRVQVKVTIEDREGNIYGSNVSPSQWLNADDFIDIQLPITLPIHPKIRYRVAIYNSGRFIAEDTSKWFSTE